MEGWKGVVIFWWNLISYPVRTGFRLDLKPLHRLKNHVDWQQTVLLFLFRSTKYLITVKTKYCSLLSINGFYQHFHKKYWRFTDEKDGSKNSNGRFVNKYCGFFFQNRLWIYWEIWKYIFFNFSTEFDLNTSLAVLMSGEDWFGLVWRRLVKFLYKKVISPVWVYSAKYIYIYALLTIQI